MAMTKTATIMVCSRCAGVISRAPTGVIFDIFDCTWPCPTCGTQWQTDDGWAEVNALLIPWRASDKGQAFAGAETPA